MDKPFSPINLPNILPEGRIPFDIFINFKNQFLCLRKAQSEVKEDLLAKLKKQNITQVYIQSECMEDYNQLMQKLLEQLLTKTDSFNDVQKADILSVTATNSMRRISINPKDRSAYTSTALTSKGMIELVLKNPATLKMFFNATLSDDILFIHSKNVSVLAVALGRKMGLKVDILLNLAIAGLLHDLGMMQMSKEQQELFLLPLEKMSKDQKRNYRMHAKKSEDLLKVSEVISPPVLDLISLHEYSLSEWPDLSMTAQVLSLANLYDKKVTVHKATPTNAYKDIKTNEIGNYHLKMISALAEVLKMGNLN